MPLKLSSFLNRFFKSNFWGKNIKFDANWIWAFKKSSFSHWQEELFKESKLFLSLKCKDWFLTKFSSIETKMRLLVSGTIYLRCWHILGREGSKIIINRLSTKVLFIRFITYFGGSASQRHSINLAFLMKFWGISKTSHTATRINKTSVLRPFIMWKNATLQFMFDYMTWIITYI